jgi:hypothetical protein
MPSAGFEPTISASELPQTYALDRAASGTGDVYYLPVEIFFIPIYLHCQQNLSLKMTVELLK